MNIVNFLSPSSSKFAYFLAPAAFALASCSHLPVKEFPSTASPGDEISRLEDDQNAARIQLVDVLAPTHFRNSVVKLREAKSDRSKDADNEDVLALVAEGRAELDKASELGRVSAVSLEGVIAARDDAKTAEAETHKAKEFAAAEKEFKEMTKDIESGDLDRAESGRDKLKSTYLALELASIKDSKLTPARAAINSAIKEGAEKDAARTLAVARKSLAEADAHITTNRHDSNGIKLRADTATANAERLLKITRDTKIAGNKDSEAIILEMEAEQKKVAEGKAALAQNQAALSKEKGDVAALEGQNQGLEAEKTFNARVDSIRARFTDAEAEVFKDGSSVLIRMKGLEFPSGKAMVSSKNFALLGKVLQASQDLGNGTMTINGHTDAIGSKVKNKKLSLDRASAIKEYFLSSSKIPESNITVAGYGDEKPISSNKDGAGRAQNRRVDVVIEPNRANMSH